MLLSLSLLVFYRPSILPTSASTTSFNLWHSLTTSSFSSSAHSMMKVAVSGPKSREKCKLYMPCSFVWYFKADLLLNFLPCPCQIVEAQMSAKTRILASSDLVCIRMDRFTDCNRVSSSILSTRDIRHSERSAFPFVDFRLTQIGICWIRGSVILRSFWSLQKAIFKG